MNEGGHGEIEITMNETGKTHPPVTPTKQEAPGELKGTFLKMDVRKCFLAEFK